VSRRPRLTVRTRLTLLYTGLFAVCGATVVAVSYILVARLEPQGQGRQAPASFVARCRSEQLSAHPSERVLAKCNAYFQLQGAQHQRDLTLSHLLQYSLITLGVVIVLAAILGWIVGGRALRPVHTITAAARAASEHNLSARVALRGPRDELHELAETFDEMLDRLQAAFEGQKRFIASASHELRTPLAVMRATVDVVLDNPDSTPADLRCMAADIRAAVDHAEHLIGALLILARNERGLTIHEEFDLATVAEDVLDTADLADRRVHTTLEPAVIWGDPVLAERLVANLVDNAVRYNAASGDCKSLQVGLSGAVASLVVVVPFVTRRVTGRLVRAFLNDPSERQGDADLAPAAGLIRSLSALAGVTHYSPAAAVSLHQTGVTGPYELYRRIRGDACR